VRVRQSALKQGEAGFSRSSAAPAACSPAARRRRALAAHEALLARARAGPAPGRVGPSNPTFGLQGPPRRPRTPWLCRAPRSRARSRAMCARLARWAPLRAELRVLHHGLKRPFALRRDIFLAQPCLLELEAPLKICGAPSLRLAPRLRCEAPEPPKNHACSRCRGLRRRARPIQRPAAPL